MRKAASQIYSFACNLKPLLVIIFVAFFTVVTVKPVYAWVFSVAANSQCENNGTVSIWVRFTNSEPVGTGQDMNVVATDEQSGATVSFGTVPEKATVDKVIYTNVSSNQNGKVRFDMTWSNGSHGSDVAWATYSGKTCVATSTPVPTVNPTVAPSATPAVTASPSATPVVSQPPIGGSTVTSAPRTDLSSGPDGLGCAVKDCSGNSIPTGGSVAGASTERSLPSTGSVSTAGVGIAYIVLLAGVYLKSFAYKLNN